MSTIADPLKALSLENLHSRLLSLISVEDCYIFGSSLNIWGHSCRIDDIDFSFSLKPNDDSDIDVGLKDYKGYMANPNLFGNRITVENLDGRRVEVYTVIGNNLFNGVEFPYYSKEDGLVYGNIERALKIYIMRKFRRASNKMRPNIPRKVRVLRAKTFAFNWNHFLRLNVSHSYDGVNFTRFTK
jgi:hypothetical protein